MYIHTAFLPFRRCRDRVGGLRKAGRSRSMAIRSATSVSEGAALHRERRRSSILEAVLARQAVQKGPRNVLLFIMPCRYTQRSSSPELDHVGMLNVRYLTDQAMSVYPMWTIFIVSHVGIRNVTSFHLSTISVYLARASFGIKTCRYTQRGYLYVMKCPLSSIQQTCFCASRNTSQSVGSAELLNG